MNNLVSIGLITYNGANRLPRALGSLLSQNYKNFELIISDNASTDDTEKICREYAVRDPRIKYIRQGENLGQFGNFRFVAAQASGEYFMWAADDDWWDPRFIEVLKNALDKNPEHGVAMSSYIRIFEDGRLFKEANFSGSENTTDLSYSQILFKMLKTSPLNKFYYGLWRAGLIKKLTSRPFASCIQWEAVPMSELALATHFYSHPEILYKVTVYPKSLALRWGKKDKLGKLYYAKWHYNKYVFTIFKQIVTSPIVPMQRKITVFPMQFLKFLWLKRGRILYEFFPGLYKALKKI